MKGGFDATGSVAKPLNRFLEFLGGRRLHFTDPDGYELAVWTEG